MVSFVHPSKNRLVSFDPGVFCETQLVQFFHDLVSNLDRAVNRNHRQTDVIIMDFSKAFKLLKL